MDTSAIRLSKPPACQPAASPVWPNEIDEGVPAVGPLLNFLLRAPSPVSPLRRQKRQHRLLYAMRLKMQRSRTKRQTPGDEALSSNCLGIQRKLTVVWRPARTERAVPQRSRLRSLSPIDGTTKQRPLGVDLCQLPIELRRLRWCHVTKVATALCCRPS